MSVNVAVDWLPRSLENVENCEQTAADAHAALGGNAGVPQMPNQTFMSSCP